MVAAGHVGLHRDPAGGQDCRSRGHQQLAAGSFEDGAHRLDRAAVLGAVLGEAREVVIEGGVDHGVRAARPGAQAVEVLERAALDVGTLRRQRLGPLVGAGEAQDLVARLDQFGDDRRSDEARGTGNEDAHRKSPTFVLETDIGYAAIPLK